MEQNEIAKYDEDLASIAAMFGDDAGFGGVDQECMAIPFLRLAQSTHDETKEGHEKYIQGLRPGMFFSPTTGRVYGKEIVAVIVKFYRSFMVYDGEDAMTSKFKGIITPVQFKTEVEPRAIRKGSYYLDDQGYRYVDARNFILYLPEFIEDGQMLYTMSSTGIPPSKQWITAAESKRVKRKKADGSTEVVQAPIWSVEWRLTAGLVQGEKQAYYKVTKVRENTENGRGGWIMKDLAETFRKAFEHLSSVSASAINAPAEEAAAEAPEDSGSQVFQAGLDGTYQAKDAGVEAVNKTFGGQAFGPKRGPAAMPPSGKEPEIF